VCVPYVRDQQVIISFCLIFRLRATITALSGVSDAKLTTSLSGGVFDFDSKD